MGLYSALVFLIQHRCCPTYSTYIACYGFSTFVTNLFCILQYALPRLFDMSDLVPKFRACQKTWCQYKPHKKMAPPVPSNLTKVITFFADVELQQHHLDLLQETPFYQFLMPFISKAVNTKHIKGTKKGLVNIIDSYDKVQQSFIIAGKQLTITPTEFDVIFGSSSGSHDIDMKDSTVSETSLGKRKFSQVTNITSTVLKSEILKSMKSSKPRDVQDTVKPLILHTMACVIFVASSDVVRWWMLRLFENLEDLKNYNWGKYVVDYLMSFIQTCTPEMVQGCTLLQV